MKILPRIVENFLLSKAVIEETPEYMRRSGGDSDCGRSEPLTTKDMKLKEHFLNRLLYGFTTYVGEFYKELTPKLTVKVEKVQGEAVIPVIPKGLIHPIVLKPLELPLLVTCHKLGAERKYWFRMDVYPTEPPTTVFVKILHKHPEFTADDILLFDENGYELDHSLRTHEEKDERKVPLKYFYYFKSELQSFEKENPIISNYFHSSQNYYLSVLAANKLDEKHIIYYEKKGKIQDIANLHHIPVIRLELLILELMKVIE